jgi:hypothetical protein
MAGDNPGGAHLQQTTARNSSIHDGPPIFEILPSIGLIGTGSPAPDHCSQENVLSMSQTIEMLAQKIFGRSRVPVQADRSFMLKK